MIDVPSLLTLDRLLEARADALGPATAFTWLIDGEREEQTLSYAALRASARAIGAHLQARLPLGARALMLYPPGLEFVSAFFGCQYAGVTAVPAFPPDPGRLGRTLPRVVAIARDCEASVVLTSRAVLDLAEALFDLAPELAALPWVATDDIPEAEGAQHRPPPADGAALAMLQYTSGSTAAPKGVMLDHRAILINQQMMVDVSAGRDQDLIFSWLPTYHDMGLFAGVVYPLSRGCSSVLMSPLHFLQRPLRWLEGLSRTGARASVGPNFAFDLCVRRSTPEQRAALDLSRWEVALLGAEPTRPATLDAFAEAFAVSGFRRSAFFPGYGLAEAVLSVTGGPERLADLDVDALGRRAVQLRPAGHPLARRLASAGVPMRGLDLRIVDPETRAPLPPAAVGEIWIGGPTVGTGYWGRPELSEQVFRARTSAGEGPYLRTGDLGFLLDGQLYVAGRIKDLIIVRGRNLYPQDVEASVEASHPALRSGCSASFAVETAEGEGVVIVAEITPGVAEPERVAEAVRLAVLQQHEVDPARVVFIAPRALPKTSSGKVQRHAARAGLEDGSLEVLYDSGTAVAAPAEPPPEPPVALAPGQGVLERLRAELARRLGVPASQLPSDRPFAELGLDSRAAVELSGELSALLGRRLSPTLFYEHPNLAALAAALDGQPEASAAPAPASSPAEPRAPVAILGLSCRFPGGADSPDALWEALLAGRDAITEIPPDRWDLRDFWSPVPAQGRSVTRHGGFLRGVEEVDDAFWGLAPREAEAMDPQHRLLLELAWEALEDAGVPPHSLAGQRVGVFVGLSTQDYARRTLGVSNPAALSPYAATGAAASVGAGRLSYHLDLRGPCFAVDTACSSSLVALVQAMHSLRRGECRLAIVAGVNLILAPDLHIIFSQLGALSPDGRCRAFAEGAQGYGRAEGGAAVVLALDAPGQGARALLRGGAINHDGRTNGLTAPSRAAQVQVIQSALADAGLKPADLSFVEAHGTGTPLGDPIELSALGEALGPLEAPVWLGSVKSNLGHTEAAAGLAGLAKAILALQAGVLPPTLHAERPTPAIDWSGLPLRLAQRATPLPARATPHRAGVSSFGFSGTNAHVVLEQAPPRPAPADRAGPHLLTLSARDEAALRAQAQALAERLERPSPPPLAGLAAATLLHRSPLERRAARVVDDGPSAISELRRLVERGAPASGAPPRLTFVFTGQGALRPGAGHELRHEPAFSETLDRLDEALGEALGVPLRRVLWPEAGEPDRLQRSTFAQPALYALQLALAALWRSWGVSPQAAFGHSLGTYAAATLAGVFDPEDGARLVAARGAWMDQPATEGAMASVRWGERALVNFLISNNFTLSISASNGPTSQVISGRSAEIEAAITALAARGVACTRLPVQTAFHSAAMEQVRQPLEARIAAMNLRPPTLPLMSDLDGEWLGAGATDARWWARHARETVRFEAGCRALAASGLNLCLELGPDAVLTAMGAALELDGVCWLPSLRRGRGDRRAMLEAAATLYERGALTPSPAGPQPGPGAALPSYPWQRRRRWMEASAPALRSGGVLYKTGWMPAALDDGGGPRRFVLLDELGGLGPALRVALRAAGAEVLEAGAPTEGPVELLSGLGLTGAADLRALPALAREALGRGRLTLLTRGGSGAGVAEPANPLAAATLGYGRCLLLEHPGAARLVDLDPRACAREAEDLAALLLAGGEPELSLRDGQALVPRLEPASAEPGGWRPRSDRSYLITGGLGGLGLGLAGWLVAAGARWLTLTGRRAPDAEARAAIQALEAAGCQVQIAAVDAEDLEATSALLKRLPRPLSGLFHLAGRLPLAPAHRAEQALVDALGGKLVGALHLDALTAQAPLEVFALISSVAGVWGGLEQGAYAAANAGLDALARSRRARGLPATSLALGPVLGAGLSAPEAMARLAEAGLDPLSMDEAIDALAGALRSERAVTVAARARWDRLAGLAAARGMGARFSRLAPPPGAPSSAAPAEAHPALTRIRAASPAEARALLTALVTEELRAALGQSPDVEIPPTRGLVDLGLDSLMAVQLVTRLKALLGEHTLPPTLVFEQPNLEALSRYLAEEVLRLPPVPTLEPSEAELEARLEALLASL